MIVLPPLSSMIPTPSTDKLPSFKSMCQDWMKDEQPNNHPLRHHFRARSVPTTLPSRPPSSAAQKQEERSSMDILLKAISLDQKMSVVYKKERVKSYVREQHKIRSPLPQFKSRELLRRRSRSAPGAPMAHYYQHQATLNTARWYLPNHDGESDRDSHDIAQALVKQHLRAVSAFGK
ncbi:hypothetical protein BC941DRAFT_451348 [Chlamydoabsidia padenii]|nr:hypothetical protein BC941DRAFT_451348 [Chlamydoabsidia padenii]